MGYHWTASVWYENSPSVEIPSYRQVGWAGDVRGGRGTVGRPFVCAADKNQRGEPRPGGTMCDVGAFEVQP